MYVYQTRWANLLFFYLFSSLYDYHLLTNAFLLQLLRYENYHYNCSYLSVHFDLRQYYSKYPISLYYAMIIIIINGYLRENNTAHMYPTTLLLIIILLTKRLDD